MSFEAAVEMIKRERPTLVPHLQQLVALAKAHPDYRNSVDQLFMQLLDMQLKIHGKRILAASLLREQPCATTEDGRSAYHCIRHIPDVTVHKLCELAEIPVMSNADPEWLAKMEAKYAG